MGKHKKIKITLLILLAITMIASATILMMAKETPRVSKTDHIAVLGYHNLAKDEDKKSFWRFDPWTSSLSSFEKQMKYLYDHGYQTISLHDFYAWKQGKKTYSNKTVVITFDDSYYSTPLLAEPILKKYGFQATTFVIGYHIPEEVETYRPDKKQHIPKSLLKNTKNMVYESHFYHLHRKINNRYAVHQYSKKALLKDIELSQKAMNMSYYAYPFGEYNDEVIAALKEKKVKLAFSYNQYHSVYISDDNYALPRYSINSYTPMFLFQYMVNH